MTEWEPAVEAVCRDNGTVKMDYNPKRNNNPADKLPGPRYAWLITKDHTAGPDEKPGTNMNAIGKCGPGGISDEQEKALAEGAGAEFKMYDDDGELYYTGRIIGRDYEGFEPLDDYGTPNAGAVRIDYDGKAL